MFYFALILIFAGLACLLYLFVAVFMSNDQKTNRSSPKPSVQNTNQHRVKKTTGPVVQIQKPASVPSEKKFSPPPTVKQEMPEEKNETESVAGPVLHGTLYYDQHRRCIQAVDHWNEVPSDFFEELKRVGPGILHYRDGAFQVETDEQRVEYEIGEMEQILFLDGGLALIPSGRKAAGVFLTRDSRKLKNFLAENSL